MSYFEVFRIDGVGEDDVDVLLDRFRHAVTQSGDERVDLGVVLVNVLLPDVARRVVTPTLRRKLLTAAAFEVLVLTIGGSLSRRKRVTQPFPLPAPRLEVSPPFLLQLVVLLALAEQPLRCWRLLPDRRRRKDERNRSLDG
ncbi:hypothetical protein BIU97_12105 [Curtobacterium sp. MCBA15_009]|nr:hypothetical protein BIU97_12105 [Curtobacterium sp. MCBA15_009]